MKAWQGGVAIVVIIVMMVVGVLVQRRSEQLLILNQLAEASLEEARRHHARSAKLLERASAECLPPTSPNTPLPPPPPVASSRLEAEVRLDRARAIATDQFSRWAELMAVVGPCIEGWQKRPVREVEPWLPGLAAFRRPGEDEGASFAERVRAVELLQGFVSSVSSLESAACTGGNPLIPTFRAALAERGLSDLYWAMIFVTSQEADAAFAGPFGVADARMAGLGLKAAAEGSLDPRADGPDLAPRVARWLEATQKRWTKGGRPLGEATLLTLLSWRVGEEPVAAWVAATAERLQRHPATVTFVEIEDTALADQEEPSVHARAFPWVPRVVAAAIVADELCPPESPEE